MKTTPISREAWLTAAVEEMRPMFSEAGATLPARIRVSVGFPGGRKSSKTKTIGECWSTAAVADGVPTILISPLIADPVTMLSTLVHELVHAADDCKSGHKKPFQTLAAAVGLTGKWTATVASEDLAKVLTKMAKRLGDIDHGVLSPAAGKKQTTRMLKVECPGCGCVVRMTRKWLDEAGTPTCGCGTRMVRADDDGE